MYRLTLSRQERSAFDWVGHRYTTGDDLARLLRHCSQTPEDREWADEGDITFAVPENIAWQINDLAEQEDYVFPCFSDELATKLTDFCNSIV